MKKGYWFLVAIGLLLIAGLFYWFQYRPSRIAKYCNQWAMDESGYTTHRFETYRENYEALYKNCQREQGVK